MCAQKTAYSPSLGISISNVLFVMARIMRKMGIHASTREED